MNTEPDPFKFGKYWIGQRYEEIPGELSEIANSVRETLILSFPDEKVYSAEVTTIFGFNWEPMLGVTQGRVYKISLQAMFKQNLTTLTLIIFIQHIINDLIAEFSRFKKQFIRNNILITIWDTNWGNIVLTQTPGRIGDNYQFGVPVALVLTATGNFPFRKPTKPSRIARWLSKL